MKRETYLFAALRFTEDENIRERTYWYLAPFEVRLGEQVLAPVGSHDRLQCARVERIVQADEENAPYAPALCKSIAAHLGARKLRMGGGTYVELGGVRYDNKHFTRFGKVILSESPPGDLSEYGVTEIINADGDALSRVAAVQGCVLLCGTRVRELAEEILRIVRGEEEDVPPSVAFAICEKFR